MGKKKEKEPDRVLIPGKPDLDRCDNKVVSARYTIYNFLPVVRVYLFGGWVRQRGSWRDVTVHESLGDILESLEDSQLRQKKARACLYLVTWFLCLTRLSFFLAFPGRVGAISPVCQSLLFNCRLYHGGWLLHGTV